MRSKKQGNYLHYKNYTGSVEFSEEDAVFHGKIIGIKALISFEGDSVSAITNDFHKAVDEYLKFCATREKNLKSHSKVPLMFVSAPISTVDWLLPHLLAGFL